MPRAAAGLRCGRSVQPSVRLRGLHAECHAQSGWQTDRRPTCGHHHSGWGTTCRTNHHRHVRALRWSPALQPSACQRQARGSCVSGPHLLLGAAGERTARQSSSFGNRRERRHPGPGEASEVEGRPRLLTRRRPRGATRCSRGRACPTTSDEGTLKDSNESSCSLPLERRWSSKTW